jgi:20S proteasome subunit beta 1
VSDKLTPLHDRIYCCRSGSAADTQALSDYARRALMDHALTKGAPPTVASAAHVFRKMCYDNKDRLLAGIIVAGWDAVEGGQVYEIPLGGTCVRGNIALGGSGSTYIHGFVDSAFRPGAPPPHTQAHALLINLVLPDGCAVPTAPPSSSFFLPAHAFFFFSLLFSQQA